MYPSRQDETDANTEPSRLACRFFYASSACIYPEGRQLDTTIEGGGLKESCAWPAQVSAPQLMRLTETYLRSQPSAD